MHRALLSDAMDAPTLRRVFAQDRRLPPYYGVGLDERVVELQAAIEALAATGERILGLVREPSTRTEGSWRFPISARSEREGTREHQIEQCPVEALDSLPYALSEGTHVLVTWD